jgi:hypothetical protein
MSEANRGRGIAPAIGQSKAAKRRKGSPAGLRSDITAPALHSTDSRE